ncbi:MFS transporter [Sphingorhabdus sp.]|jgi:EmrB/QacA subfamily drug resistance transporter|uniref:MFS transporter n=1 Tax=Sphingorhabdus sp. TaxID=1902408 RepID=UPI0037C6E376
MQPLDGTDEENKIFYRLVIPLMVAELVAALELTMIYAALPTLVREYGGTSEAGWLVTSFMLSAAAGAALFGRLGDLLGRRNVLLWVLALSTLGSVISSMTKDLELLILGRTLQGFAGAIVPLCFGIIRERVSLKKVPLGIGLISSTVTIASASGLVIGGIIIDYADWTMIFKITTTLGLFAFFTIFFFVAKDRLSGKAGALEDILGGLLFIPAVVSLLLGITQIAKHGLFETTSILWIMAAAIFLGAWIWRELSVKNPLLDVRLLAKPEIAWPNIVMVFIALGAYQSGHLMALFGQQPLATGIGLGLTATMAGFLLLPANILAGLSTPFVGVAVQRYGPRLLARISCALICSAFLLLTFFNSNMIVVILLLILQGVGLGALYVITPVVIVHATPPDRTSEASGMMGVIRSTAMAVGAQTIAALLATGGGNHGGNDGHALPSAAAYQTAFLYVAGMAFIALLLCQMLPKKLSDK